MKKIISIVILIILIVAIIYIKPIRTVKIMEEIAKDELREPPLGLFTEAYYNAYKGQELDGPLIIDKGRHIEFQWYKVLKWGDTASVYANVYKYPNSFSWRDNFFWTNIGMNEYFYYYSFQNGTSKFEDILPSTHKKGVSDSLKYKPYYAQNKVADSISFIINIERLFYFLQKGYFIIIEKNDDYTVVDFYEPIANIIYKHSNDTISTMSAKIFFNDSLEVFIIPQIAQEKVKE